MATETWIVYKADSMSASGWEDRMLMPGESLTDILEENWTSEEHPTIPEVGDRTRDYRTDANGSITHGKSGDWVVTRVERFASFDTDTRIVICYCQYQPIAPEWEPLQRSAPVNKVLTR